MGCSTATSLKPFLLFERAALQFYFAQEARNEVAAISEFSAFLSVSASELLLLSFSLKVAADSLRPHGL